MAITLKDILLDVNVDLVGVGSAVTHVKTATALTGGVATSDDWILVTDDKGVTVNAGDGDDRIWDKPGNDLLFGGNGQDHLFAGVGNDTLSGGGGNDTLLSGDDSDFVYGGNGDDTAYAWNGTDFLFGEAGNDLLNGEQGDDFLYGGSGSDKLYGGDGNDFLSGDGTSYGAYTSADAGSNVDADYNDLLQGDAGNDTLVGGRGSDTFRYAIYAGNKNVDFASLWGNDSIKDFKSGTDKLDLGDLFSRLGEADVTKLIKVLAGKPVSKDPDFATRQGKWGFGLGTDKIYKLHGLNGEKYEVRIVGSSHYGKAETKIFFTTIPEGKTLPNKATTASITLDGVSGLKSTDFVRETQKLVYATPLPTGVKLNVMDFSTNKGTQLWKTVLGNKGILFRGLEISDKVTGTAHDDKILGLGGDGELHGGKGNDNVRGQIGDDKVYGEDGDDDLSGDQGNDMLYGGAGNDKLNGQWGDDYLDGGDGNDLLRAEFAENTIGDTLHGGAGNDIFEIAGNVIDHFGPGTVSFEPNIGLVTIDDFTKGEDKISFASYWVANGVFEDVPFFKSFLSTWGADHIFKSVDGKDMLITGDNNGATAGGEWQITVKGWGNAVDETTATHLAAGFQLSDFFLM